MELLTEDVGRGRRRKDSPALTCLLNDWSIVHIKHHTVPVQCANINPLLFSTCFVVVIVKKKSTLILILILTFPLFSSCFVVVLVVFLLFYSPKIEETKCSRRGGGGSVWGHAWLWGPLLTFVVVICPVSVSYIPGGSGWDLVTCMLRPSLPLPQMTCMGYTDDPVTY